MKEVTNSLPYKQQWTVLQYVDYRHLHAPYCLSKYGELTNTSLKYMSRVVSGTK
jgi:hypothetical protein